MRIHRLASGEEVPIYSWMGMDWIPSLGWGTKHPNIWWMYMSEYASYIRNDVLHLTTSYRPKEYDSISVPMACGMFCTLEEVKYGLIEIEAMLPTGIGQWPAFWTSNYGWQGEIDAFEGYTELNGDYFTIQYPLHNIWKLYTNFWWDNGKGTLKPKSFYLERDPARYWNKYSIYWHPNHIKILVNDRVVRELTDLKVIDAHFQRPASIRISTGITELAMKHYYNNELPMSNEDQGIFRIKRFQYTPLHKL